MKHRTLIEKFNYALVWNGILFLISKLSKTGTSFLLFYTLSVADFATWANVYSLVFILALWLDFGFRRSVPLFSLYFAKNQQAKSRFIKNVILFKLAVALGANALLIIFGSQLATKLGLSAHHTFFYLGGGMLFAAENLKSSLRLVYHSYFWQKQFNLIETSIITLQMGALGVSWFVAASSTMLLYLVFIGEIAAQFLIVAIGLLLLTQLKKDINYQGDEPIDTPDLANKFVKHSAVMWGMLSINSITERNFLIPLLTYLFGPAIAGMFKVANDGALLLQRCVLKTIGTTDTSLLAHIESGQVRGGSKQSLMQQAFTKLNRRVVALTAPLIGLVILMLLQLRTDTFGIPTELPQTFFVLAMLYLIQIFFIGYDRILEVKRNYRVLISSAAPYLGIGALYLGLGFYKKYTAIVAVSVIQFLVSLHALRIMSLGIRVFISRRLYGMRYPLRFATTVLGSCLVGSVVLYCTFDALGLRTVWTLLLK